MESRKIKLESKNLSLSHQHYPEDKMSSPFTSNIHSTGQLYLLEQTVSHQTATARCTAAQGLSTTYVLISNSSSKLFLF